VLLAVLIFLLLAVLIFLLLAVLIFLLLAVLIFLLWAVLLFLWSYYSFSWWPGFPALHKCSWFLICSLLVFLV
jgi:hypothetical protein